MTIGVEDAALEALDVAAMVGDASAALKVPSVTGGEREVLEQLAETCSRLGLEPDLHRHDLAALRAHPGHPGEEAARDELWGLTASVPGGERRICLNGHVDVVDAGTEPWRLGPWSGEASEGFLHGRGSVDMKAAVVAMLHAAAAVRASGVPAPTLGLQCVSSEEDGGLGTFAALERDGAFDAAVIPEPTAFDVVCAQAGALTFHGTIPGRSAHAAVRLSGHSAIDRYVRVHAALAEHERRMNADVAHPLMQELELPYPLLVGRVAAGAWSSQVPDRLEFEGRVGVRVGEPVAEARAALEAVVAGALDDGEAPARIAWTGGSFASADTPVGDPWIVLVRDAAAAELGRPVRAIGVPWGADMRLFSARGIPCTMIGTGGIELAHGVDERVEIAQLEALARLLVRVIVRSGGVKQSPVSPAAGSRP
jgi:acetylornithine deacetylase